MLRESQRLEREIKRYREEISKLPKGKLIHVQNGKYHQWHHRDDVGKAESLSNKIHNTMKI